LCFNNLCYRFVQRLSTHQALWVRCWAMHWVRCCCSSTLTASATRSPSAQDTHSGSVRTVSRQGNLSW
jgi:hypothetical protein